MNSNFQIAIEKTLAHEGGYVNDPADPGGETKYGISKRAYPHLDIGSLTREQAIALYEQDYWTAAGLDQIRNMDIAAKVFDLGVNMGPARAVRLLQQAVNRFCSDALAVDGRIGPMTAAAVNTFAHPDVLLMALRIEAGNRYYGIDNPKFLAGWLRRLAA